MSIEHSTPPQAASDDTVDGFYGETEEEGAPKYLTFKVSSEEYGVNIAHVTEIVGMQKITPVPDVAPFVRGVINLRGRIIPMMDVRARFHFPERDYDERTCVIVVQLHDVAVGLIVDEVSEVVEVPEEQIDPPPDSRERAGQRFIMGLGKVGEQVVILLDVDYLLTRNDWGQVDAPA